MTNEESTTPPHSPKTTNIDPALPVTPIKSYNLMTVTEESLEREHIRDAHVSRMSPSIEDAVHALTTLKSEKQWKCGAKRKISGIEDDAKPRKKRDMKKLQQDEDKNATFRDLQFWTLKEAKEAFESHLHAIGVYRDEDMYTVRVMTDITDVPYYAMDTLNWMYLRCFYKRIDRFVRTKVNDIVPVINKRGSVRQTYNISDRFMIKQIHHTCVALAHENVCRNCSHPKWNSRCVRGHTTFFICSR